MPVPRAQRKLTPRCDTQSGLVGPHRDRLSIFICPAVPGGLRRVLEVLGPAMQSWWRDLGDVTLTPPIIDRVVASAEDLIAAEDAEHLASRRDAAVARILEAAIDKQDPETD